MRILIGLTLLLGLLCDLTAQDFQTTLSSNPSLFKNIPNKDISKLKQFVQEDSIIYNYDTLSLPFIDDFSSDHLPERISDLSSANVSDTTLYKLYLGNQVDTDTNGYRTDTTFYYQIGSQGDTVLRVPNSVIFLRVHDLTRYPSTNSPIDVFPPYHIVDTIGLNKPDTIEITPNLVQESKTYYLVKPNANDWYTNRDVLINNTFAILPVSYGVATFDGLNQYGMPYSPDFAIQVQADFLTSVPIDLSTVSGDSSVFFSFYYQPGGLSFDPPAPSDSLSLDFYDVSTKRWGNVWATGGYSADTFKRVMIQVDKQFHENGFQFRFRNRGQGAGAYDHWHIDYLYLNDGRTKNDTSTKDLTFVTIPDKLLKDYYTMPWWHFKSNPALYQADKVKALVRNNNNQALNIYYRMTLDDTLPDPPFYKFPLNNSFFILQPQDTLTLDYNINFDYTINDIAGPGLMPATYSIDFNPGSNPSDFILENDTIKTGINLQNYYAYDDGTAEVGYGVNPQLSSEGYVAYMAVQHEIPFRDTIGGVQIYFLPTFPDIQKQSFELMVWDNLNENAVVFSKPELDKPIYTDDNGFITYWFDSLVVVNQSFYIGMKSIGLYSKSIGMDLNTNNRDKIFWSHDGNFWSNPSGNIRDGSLMIRPIFRKKKFGVGLNELAAKKESTSTWFPNPVNHTLFTNYNEKLIGAKVNIYGVSGNLIKTLTYHQELDVSDLKEGLYLIQTVDKTGNSVIQKIIKAK